jgi:beta-hydroxylase
MYEFVKTFEDSWEKIYQEYLGIKNNMKDWPEYNIYNDGWEVHGIFNWPGGEEKKNHNCPFTANLINEVFPNGHGTAGFSRLKPNTIIYPHFGHKGNFLRAHLGLEVPEGDCALEVEDRTIIWEVGKMVIFDDRKLHNAWNRTDKERVVLLLDFYE